MITIGIDASRANVTQRTGTEWYCYYLLQQFAKLYRPDQQRVIIYVKEALVADLNFFPADWEVRILRWPPRLLWTQLRLSLAMLWPGRRPDLLFIPAHTIPIVHPACTVYVAHDLGFERDPLLYANSYIGGKAMHWFIKLVTLGRYGTTELDYHRWSMRYAASQASKIITISEFTKKELQACYQVSDERIQVIHNGYDRKQFVPAITQPTTSTQPPYLFYVGRIERKKNIDHLLAAFARLKELHPSSLQLWLAGSLGYGFRDLRPSADVKLLGYVSAQQLPMLMQQAQVFVFPSNYEGFGIPVIEALACGTKVACSDIPALREVGGASCWYFNQTDPADMATVIQQALQADSTQARAVNVAQAQHYSWEKCGQETWQALIQAVA